MPAPAVTNITMRNAKAYFGNMATTNLYQVFIGDGWQGDFTTKLSRAEQIDFGSFGTTLGLMCSDASLPASTYATAEVKDNFMGVTQEFAHTRIYTDIDFTFYIDHDYQVLKFFEFWMNFVSGGGSFPASTDPSSNGFRRFNYPKYYKNSQVYIKKFERDYLLGGKTSINYQFINAFPKSVTSIPVSYGPTDLLKITVTMNYDRYVYGKEVSNSPSKENQGTQQTTEKPVPPTPPQPTTAPSNRELTPTEIRQGVRRDSTTGRLIR
jgi:hypothetical protein